MTALVVAVFSLGFLNVPEIFQYSEITEQLF